MKIFLEIFARKKNFPYVCGCRTNRKTKTMSELFLSPRPRLGHRIAATCCDCQKKHAAYEMHDSFFCRQCAAFYEIRHNATEFVDYVCSIVNPDFPIKRKEAAMAIYSLGQAFGKHNKELFVLQTEAGRAVYYSDPDEHISPRLIFPPYAPDTLCHSYLINFSSIEEIIDSELVYQRTLADALAKTLNVSSWNEDDFEFWQNDPDFLAHGIDYLDYL